MQVPRITQISAILNYILLSVSVFPMIKKKRITMHPFKKKGAKKKKKRVRARINEKRYK